VPHVYTIEGAFGADEGTEASSLPVPVLPPEVAQLKDEITKVKKERWYLAGGSALIGLLLGIFVGVAVK